MSTQESELYLSGVPREFTRDPTANLPEYIENSTEEIEEIYSRLKETFYSEKTKPIEFRKHQLLSLYKGIVQESKTIVEAIARDFKTVQDAKLELHVILQEITGFIKNLDEWLAPEEVSKPAAMENDSTKIVREPYGLLLYITTWNLPFMLAMEPLLGAIATGNCFLLKTSELVPNSSAVISYIIKNYLDPDCYAVANGDKEIAIHILKKKWDFIAYTGNGTVGRIIMAAAAKHLTPTLLELGGKSPAIIDDETCDLRVAARRILWAKCLNAGQICLAADYIICRPSIKDRLVEILKEELHGFYGDSTQDNPSWPRIVSKNHCERIIKMIPTTESSSGYGKVVHGGRYNIESRYIEPTIVTEIDPDIAPVMQSEIFGPIIPIIVSDDIDSTIRFLKKRDKPLGLYIFSDNHDYINRLLTEISSGGVSINDTLMHYSINTLPFGGIGESGMGSYHGRHSIDQFSHKRAVYAANNYREVEPMLKLRYPGQNITSWVPFIYDHNQAPPTLDL